MDTQTLRYQTTTRCCLNDKDCTELISNHSGACELLFSAQAPPVSPAQLLSRGQRDDGSRPVMK